MLTLARVFAVALILGSLAAGGYNIYQGFALIFGPWMYLDMPTWFPFGLIASGVVGPLLIIPATLHGLRLIKQARRRRPIITVYPHRA